MDRAANRKNHRSARKVGQAAWRGVAEMLERRVLMSGNAIDLLDGSPATFIQNKGQWDSNIRYAMRSSGANVLMTDNGPIYQIFKRDKNGTVGKQFFAEFEGANTVRPTGSNKSSAAFNFFLGDKDDWRRNVPGYEQINYTQLYDGIDLHTWGRSSSLKYEFHVAPGIDYSQIKVSYDGIKGLSIDSKGRLHVKTELGTLVDDAPVVYQLINGKQVEVAASFKLIDKDTYTFEIKGDYDRSKELVIDPDLDWSTFLGGDQADAANAVVTDNENNVYVTGSTQSPTFPVTIGAYDTTYEDEADAFITKFDSTGAVLFSTFFGGGDDDIGNDIALDSAGTIFIVGETTSNNLPATVGTDTQLGGTRDAFLARFSAGGGYFWSTYLGGTGIDRGTGIVTNNSDIVTGSGQNLIFVTGETQSTDFPTTVGQDVVLNGTSDAFITAYSTTPAGSPAAPTVSWSTYVGGSAVEIGRDIAFDGEDRISIVGSTTSADLATVGAPDAVLDGTGDAFVANFSTAGVRNWITYVGGTGVEEGNAIGIDNFGRILIAGSTTSIDLFTTGGFDTIANGGTDAFVIALQVTGLAEAGTYIGGLLNDVANGIAIDDAGTVVITGTTASADFPSIEPTFALYNGGQSDGFVVGMTDLDAVTYATFLGGSNNDTPMDIAIDLSGAFVVVGSTQSANFPVQSGTGIPPVFGGGNFTDAFVARIAPSASAIVPLAPLNLKATAVNYSRIDLSWTDQSANELGFEVLRRTGNGAFAVIATLPPNTQKYSDTGLTPNTTYEYQVRAFNVAGGSLSNTVTAKTKTAELIQPANLKATSISGKRIDLEWDDTSTNETGFEIYRSVGTGGGTFTLIATVAAGSTSYRDQTGLSPETTYAYRIRAVNPFRTSTFTQIVTATTKPASFIVAPSGLSAVRVSDSAVSISWTDNSDNEASFVIQRRIVGETTFVEIGSTGANDDSFTDTEASSDQIYVYRVRAVNGVNTSAFSNLATSDLDIALANPTRAEALAVSDSQIKLTWLDNSLIESGFIIERAINRPSDFRVIGETDANTGVFYDKHVISGRRYYYRVRATDDTNFSLYSNNATDRALPELVIAPRTPNLLRAKVAGNGDVRLTWRDNSRSENAYVVERATSIDGPFEQIKRLAADTTRFIDKSVAAGRDYFYRVRAYDGIFRSAPSGIARVTTPVPVKVTLTTLEPEGAEPSTGLKFLVRRKGDYFGSLDVHYVVSGTATNGQDYELLSGVVTIADVDPTAQIVVATLDDALVEGTETLTVRIVSTNRYKVSPNTDTATGTIFDDEPQPTASSLASATTSVFSRNRVQSGAIDLIAV